MKILVYTMVVLLQAAAVFPADANQPEKMMMEDALLDLEKIIAGIENRYAGAGFAAEFFQESTLREMDITDTASGKIFVKRPGKMRWEYEIPEKQTIVTDSKRLWIYRPEDNQVMVGNAPSYLGDGKGASFLADMKHVRKNFKISLQIKGAPKYYVLKLLPVKENIDVVEILLSVSKETFEIVQIVSYDAYRDRTRIKLSGFDFERVLDDSMFRFTVPPGADVLQLDK